MRIVAHSQGTKPWHEWRNKGLGASDAGTVLGVSPYKTPFEYWLERTGQAPRQELNAFAVAAMQRGTEMEPAARAWYERQVGIPMTSPSAEHDLYPYIRASFDGISLEHGIGCEIKCMGKTNHQKVVKTGKIPEIYVAQIQQQLLVSGISRIDFVAYSGTDDGQNVIIQVFPDRAYQERLLRALIEFWLCVESRTPPKLDQRDLGKLLERLNADLEKVKQTAYALSVVQASLGVRK